MEAAIRLSLAGDGTRHPSCRRRPMEPAISLSSTRHHHCRRTHFVERSQCNYYLQINLLSGTKRGICLSPRYQVLKDTGAMNAKLAQLRNTVMTTQESTETEILPNGGTKKVVTTIHIPAKVFQVADLLPRPKRIEAAAAAAAAPAP